MVPSKSIKNELAVAFAANLKKPLGDDYYRSNGPVSDLVFELATLDGEVAGIASRLLKGGPAITREEKKVLLERDFLVGTIWKGNDCNGFDLSDDLPLLAYVQNIEHLRILCLRAVNSHWGS